jgi:hypothetical protein
MQCNAMHTVSALQVPERNALAASIQDNSCRNVTSPVTSMLIELNRRVFARSICLVMLCTQSD